MQNHIKNALTTTSLLAAALVTLNSCGKTDSDTSASASVSTSAAAPASGGEMVEFDEKKIGFPQAMFTGTPVPPGKVENLETPGKPVTSFQAPKGTELISLNKPVTSSDKNIMIPSADGLKLITDGEKDSNDGSFVELAPEPTWVQIDLQGEFNVHQIVAWHFHRQALIFKDVVVQVSSDAEFKSGVTTIYNSDHDDTLKLGAGTDKSWIQTNHGRMMPGKGAKGRYVRLWSNGNTEDDFNRYIEVSVYGTPAK
jgi:hypothetical protein